MISGFVRAIGRILSSVTKQVEVVVSRCDSYVITSYQHAYYTIASHGELVASSYCVLGTYVVGISRAARTAGATIVLCRTRFDHVQGTALRLVLLPSHRGVRVKRSERYILIPWYLRLAPTTSHLARGSPLSSGSYHAATITVIPLDCGWTMLNLMSRSDWQIRQSIALRYRCLLVMFMQKSVAHVKSPWPLVAAPRSQLQLVAG